jgi:hypothetical protein
VKLSLATLALAYAVFFACIYATAGILPLRVSSHFDAAGQPNGWMNRDSYLGFTCAMGIGLPLFIAGVAALAARSPVGSFKIPNRAYWLAPERRAFTVAIMIRFMIGFASMLVLFLTGMHLLVVAACVEPRYLHLVGAGFWLLAMAFLAATGIWTFMLVRRFWRTS